MAPVSSESLAPEPVNATVSELAGQFPFFSSRLARTSRSNSSSFFFSLTMQNQEIFSAEKLFVLGCRVPFTFFEFPLSTPEAPAFVFLFLCPTVPSCVSFSETIDTRAANSRYVYGVPSVGFHP